MQELLILQDWRLCGQHMAIDQNCYPLLPRWGSVLDQFHESNPLLQVYLRRSLRSRGSPWMCCTQDTCHHRGGPTHLATHGHRCSGSICDTTPSAFPYQILLINVVAIEARRLLFRWSICKDHHIFRADVSHGSLIPDSVDDSRSPKDPKGIEIPVIPESDVVDTASHQSSE